MNNASAATTDDIELRLARLEQQNEALRSDLAAVQARLADTITTRTLLYCIVAYTATLGVLRALGI